MRGRHMCCEKYYTESCKVAQGRLQQNRLKYKTENCMIIISNLDGAVRPRSIEAAILVYCDSDMPIRRLLIA